MNDPIKAVTGASLIGVVAVFAMYGKPFLEAALGAWLFLLEITKTAPMGLAAFFAALALATMLVLALDRWVPFWANLHCRRSVIELLALSGAVGVAWIQIHSLNGLLFGILAGLMAPLLARMGLGLATFVGNRFNGR